MAAPAMRSRYSSKASRPLERADRFCQLAEDTAVAVPARTGPALEQLAGVGRRLPVGRSVSQAHFLLAQDILLVGIAKMRGSDFVHLIAQHIGLAGPLLRITPE